MACCDALGGADVEKLCNRPVRHVGARAARVRPGLLLARIDGKSPVEYVTDEADKEKVRRAAGKLLSDPVSHLEDVRRAWAEEL